jgi:spore coat polysaccharide biosynthesis protein SpsF (cytidylyltransferase family)
MKTIIIIQARMGSTRLPGKVLMKINGITLLESLLEQINHCKSIDEKIVATTTREEDDEISTKCLNAGVEIFRGNPFDVLDRYYQCAQAYSGTNIVRLTADNPFIDPNIIDNVVTIFQENSFDYVNNCEIRTFPHGTEVEVFSFSALEKAWKNAKNPYDREHVTPFLRNKKIFKTMCIKSKEDLSNFRWTVDTIEDLNFIRKLYQQCNTKPIVTENLLEIINQNKV